MKRTLCYEASDNVLVALEDLSPGDIAFAEKKESCITALRVIPCGHKIAAERIEKDQPIIKMGHVIGYARASIPVGDYVHTHNVRDAVSKWGDTEHPYTPHLIRELSDELLREKVELWGYHRKNGLVGFRNHILVVSTVVCANQPVEEIGYRFRDVITISNPTGCVILPDDVTRLKALLLGLARNPNVGGVVFCGLGCEAVDPEWYFEEIKGEKPAAFVRIQTEGSCAKAAEKIAQIVLRMKRELDGQPLQRARLRDIRLGTKCGGSDWTTAAVANPVIGMVSDVIVKNGGISIQGETTGWFGAESFFIEHARTKEVAEKIIALMRATYRKCENVGRHIEEGNPTPGNIAGGITTLAEKALGNVRKGGDAPVEGVLDIGEYPPPRAGLYLANNPGLDPISLLGLTSSGANVLFYSTGRGSPVGTPIAPSIKLTASPTSMDMFSAHIDVDVTAVTFGNAALKDGAEKLFQKMIDVCNGEKTIAEKNRNREVAFPLAVSPL